MTTKLDYPNPNLVAWAKVPTISHKIMKQAYEWSLLKTIDSNPRTIIKISDQGKTVLFTTSLSRSKVILTKPLCRQFISNEFEPDFNQFDGLINYFKSIYRVIVNDDEWKHSKCNCFWYQKHNICWHVIALCAKYKVEGCSFETIALDNKLAKKPRRGRKPKRKNCLVRGSSESDRESTPLSTPVAKVAFRVTVSKRVTNTVTDSASANITNPVTPTSLPI